MEKTGLLHFWLTSVIVTDSFYMHSYIDTGKVNMFCLDILNLASFRK